MSLYIPVITGETAGLRAETESFLSGDHPDAIDERIALLDERSQVEGASATFAAEVELQFFPDPTRSSASLERGKEQLYEEVIRGVPGYIEERYWDKGIVFAPHRNAGPITHNGFINGTYNNDQKGSEIIEVRLAPAGAKEATERYWNVIQSVGAVAAQHGYMGMILSTHINAGVYMSYGRSHRLLDFAGWRAGGSILAAAQHNLHAMQPLQFDAGLQTGATYLEAFPSKDGTTAVHPERLEFRHPTTAIADPRVYALAMLAGLNQTLEETVPKNAMRPLRHALVPDIRTESGSGIKELESITTWDVKSQRLVLPLQVQESARALAVDTELDRFLAEATGEDLSSMDNNAQLLRTVVRAIRQRGEDEMVIDSASPYAKRLRSIAAQTRLLLDKDTFRVEPVVSFDSPEMHKERRKHILHSATVRAVLGKAACAIAPVSEAIERRQALIDAQMIISEEEDAA